MANKTNDTLTNAASGDGVATFFNAYEIQCKAYSAELEDALDKENQRKNLLIEIEKYRNNTKSVDTMGRPKEGEKSEKLFSEFYKKEAVSSMSSKVSKNAGNIIEQLGKTVIQRAGNFAISEARYMGNSASGLLSSYENKVVNAIGEYVDDKLQSTVAGIADSYYSARNYILDKLEEGLSSLMNGVTDALGQNYEKPNTIGKPSDQYETQKISSSSSKADAVVEAIVKAMYNTKNPDSLVGGSLSDKNNFSGYSGDTSEIIRSYLTNLLDAGIDALARGFQTNGIGTNTNGVDNFQDYGINQRDISSIKKVAKSLEDVDNISDSTSNPANFQSSGKSITLDDIKRITDEAKIIIEESARFATVSLNKNGKALDNYAVMSLMEKTKNRYYSFDYITGLLSSTDTGATLMDKAKSLLPSNLLNEVLYMDNGTGWLESKLANLQNSASVITQSELLQDSDTNLTGKDPSGKFQNSSESEIIAGYIADVMGNIGKDVLIFNSTNRDASLEEKFISVVGSINSSSKGTSLAPAPIWDSLRNNKEELYGMNSIVHGYRVNRLRDSREIDLFQNGYFHLFFVKPDLNLTENVCGAMDYLLNPLLGDIITNLNYNNNELADSWDTFPAASYNYSGANPYMSYLFSNMAKSCPISDLNLETKDAWENVFGVKMSYGTSIRKSTLGQDFSIPFLDNKNLLVMNTIQAWIKYIAAVKEGVGDSTRKSHNFSYLDYCGALYGFITEPDGISITHWFRYTGIFPTVVPWSSISLSPSQDIPEFNVNFKSQFYETNDVVVLHDFNFIMNGGNSSKYYEQGSITPMSKSDIKRSASVANLRGGPTITESKILVKYSEEKVNTSVRSPYRFLLDFSSPDINETANVLKAKSESYQGRDVSEGNASYGGTLGSIKTTATVI